MLNYPMPSYGSTETTEQIENDVIRPFLDWARTNVIQSPEVSKLAKAFGAIGFITGAVGVYAFFPLGGNFANITSDFFEIHNVNARKFIYGLFAIDAIIPMIALSGLATKNHFQQLITPNREYPLISKKNRQFLRKGLKATAYVLGMFAAITPAYVTSTILKDEPIWVKILMSIPAYLGGFMYKVDAENRLLDKTFNTLSMGKTELIKNMRIALKKNLIVSINKITTIEDQELDWFFSEIIGKDYLENSGLSVQKQTMDRLKLMFFNPEQDQTRSGINTESNLKKYGKKITNVSGFIIGAVSSYTYFSLGEAAGLVICDWLKLNDPQTREIISKFIASLVIVPWAALGAEATKNRFEQMYCSFFDKRNNSINEQSYPKLRKVISGYSVFGGASAAIPLTYLAIEATKNMPLAGRIMLIIPAFLGPSAVRTNAINLVLNQGVNWINGFRQETSVLKRDKLINAMNTISSALDKLPDDQIMELYINILESRNNLLLNINDDITTSSSSNILDNNSTNNMDITTPLLGNYNQVSSQR